MAGRRQFWVSYCVRPEAMKHLVGRGTVACGMLAGWCVTWLVPRPLGLTCGISLKDPVSVLYRPAPLRRPCWRGGFRQPRFSAPLQLTDS